MGDPELVWCLVLASAWPRWPFSPRMDSLEKLRKVVTSLQWSCPAGCPHGPLVWLAQCGPLDGQTGMGGVVAAFSQPLLLHTALDYGPVFQSHTLASVCSLLSGYHGSPPPRGACAS